MENDRTNNSTPKTAGDLYCGFVSPHCTSSLHNQKLFFDLHNSGGVFWNDC